MNTAIHGNDYDNSSFYPKQKQAMTRVKNPQSLFFKNSTNIVISQHKIYLLLGDSCYHPAEQSPPLTAASLASRLLPMAPGGASATSQALLTAALAQVGLTFSTPLLELDLMVSTYATSVQMRGVAMPTGISIGLNRGAPVTIDASTAFGGALSAYLPLLTRIGTQQQRDGVTLLSAASASSTPLAIAGALLNFAAFGTSASYSSWAGAAQPFSLKFSVPIPPALVASLPPSVSFDSLMVNVVAAAAGSGSGAAVTYAVSLGAGCSVVLPSFAFSAAANGGTAAAASGADEASSRGVLRVEATATWSSVTQRLSVSAALNTNGGATLYPFRARWIGVSQISLRFDASTAPDVVARLPTSNLAFGMLVTVTTGQGASVAIPMAASFRAAEPSSSSGGPPVFLLRADNVPLASLVPTLASSVTGFVTVIVSNVHTTVPNATSSTLATTVAKGGAFAFNCVPGLNFFATDFNLQPGAFQGALATLNARGTSRMASSSSPSSILSTVFPGNVPFDVPIAANASLTGVFSPADGAVSIAYTNAYVPIGGGSSALSVSLRQVSIGARVALNPAPGSYAFALDAQLVAAVPNLPPIAVDVGGRFRADAGAAGLTVSGALPAWPALFGLPWLALGATRVTARFASSATTTTRMLSVTSTATVSSAALSMTVPLCGVLSCVLLLLCFDFCARPFLSLTYLFLIIIFPYVFYALKVAFCCMFGLFCLCALRRHR